MLSKITEYFIVEYVRQKQTIFFALLKVEQLYLLNSPIIPLNRVTKRIRHFHKMNIVPLTLLILIPMHSRGDNEFH